MRTNPETGRNSRNPEDKGDIDMAGMLDELFEDLIKEPEQEDEKEKEEKENNGDGSQAGNEDEDKEPESPLFPTGEQWEGFKKGHKFGA